MHAPVPPLIPPDILLLGYRSGVFPMADSREDPDIFWVEPKRRAIIPLDEFHCSHSLAKLLKRDRFTVTCNKAFDEVIASCAAPRPDHPESWISERIAASYRALHLAGYAHSIECWRGSYLMGGLYGVGFDRVFCGESMFSRAPNASKIALCFLVAAMRRAGCSLLDCQFMTDHLATLGAREIDREHYLQLLTEAQANADEFDGYAVPSGFSALVGGGGAGTSLVDGAGEGSSPGKLIAQSLTQTS